MNFLRITASNGIKTMIPEGGVVQITTAADTVGAATDNASGHVTRGLITAVKYNDAATAVAQTVVIVTGIVAFTTGGVLYEFGTQSTDGAFNAVLSNGAL